ncbi:MAG: hypothetical protein ACK42H_03710, partial [Planctomycetota bacterium]
CKPMAQVSQSVSTSKACGWPYSASNGIKSGEVMDLRLSTEFVDNLSEVLVVFSDCASSSLRQKLSRVR